MEAGTIVSIVFGVIAIVSAIVGSAWKIAGSMSRLETRLSSLEIAIMANVQKTEETHKLVRDHASDCDTNRAELDVKAKALAHTIDDHTRRIGKLETS